MAEGFTPPEDFNPDGNEGNEAEKIEMEYRDSWKQTPDYFPKPQEQETMFVDLADVPVASDAPLPLEKQTKINK